MKHNISNAESLTSTISRLELRCSELKKGIGSSFSNVSSAMKPSKLIKSSANSVFTAGNKERFAGSVIALISGYLVRKIILKKTNTAAARYVGNMLQWGLTALVAKNSDKIKTQLIQLIDKIFKSKKNTVRFLPPGTIHK